MNGKAKGAMWVARVLGVLALCVGGIAACRPLPGPGTGAQAAEAAPTISLFVTAQIGNTTEPCGCTSEPLGDVARIAGLVAGAGGRGLLLDAGGLRYKPVRLPPEQLHQARLKADFLEQLFARLSAAVMLQPSDLLGPDGVKELAAGVRLASNLSFADGVLPASALKRTMLRTVGGVPIGILGIVDPEGQWPPGATVSDPLTSAQKAVDELRAQGAKSIVALTGLRRDAVRRLARRAPGIDLFVIGADPELVEGLEQAEQVGGALLVAPGSEGQHVVRIDLHLPAPGAQPVWTLRLSPGQKQRAVLAQKQKVEKLEARLAELRRDPQAEPAFVQTTEAELLRLRSALKDAEAASSPSAEKLGYVTAELVPIGRWLPRDKEVQAAMAALDRRIGEANLKAQSGPPPTPPPGRPSFVGNAACQGECHFHDDAFTFWQKTQHAQAFPTLVQAGKDLSYDCVSCHAAGFDELGGSNLFTLAAWQRATPGAAKPAVPDLRNVQCEVCHGPGSLHVSAPSKNRIGMPQPTEERCLVCHTKEHSDTFAFVPYLRDILGPGHGEAKRAALGAGPTAHELRAAKKNASAHQGVVTNSP
jgi:hypothetical protein